MTSLKEFYSQRIELLSSTLQKLKKHLNLLSVGRLLFFLLIILSPFKIYPVNHIIGISITLVALIVFLSLVKRHIKVKTEKRFNENLLQINKDELLSLNHQYSQFNEGNEFIDPTHINSYDLDLFGNGSMFQFLNRTVTPQGKKQLAFSLQNPILDLKQIVKRQEFNKELSDKQEWRHTFAARGQLYLEDEKEGNLLEMWGNEKFQLRLQKITLPLLFIFPAFSICSVLYWIFFGNPAMFIISGLLQLSFWVIERKNIRSIYEQFGKRQEILSKYTILLEMVENEKWQSDEGKTIIIELKSNGTPSKEISRLKKIISVFDNRNNFLIGFLLNMTSLWDILFSYLLIKWHNENKSNYKYWYSTIAFFDTQNSFANFAFNHPEYVFPVMENGEFKINTENLGHPLIHPGRRINNDFRIEGSKKLIIVTGANMAGKSTFLRTVGINIILGMNGTPVCASKFTMTPVEVFSNMRTTDSLFSDESYFFAELKRIKAILDELEKGRKMLIILDEILKGTNSEDKLRGSEKLVKKLIGLKTPSIIATHDLKLTEMENEFHETIGNLCFEIEISNDEMHFDYKLKEGVTKMMNATFLMKKMGIID